MNKALIVVDMQNDFGHPAGALYVNGADKVIPAVGEVIHNVQHCLPPPQGTKDLIIFTKDRHPVKTSHFDNWPPHCVADTWGYDLVGDLHHLTFGSQTFIKGLGDKDDYSGFDGVHLIPGQVPGDDNFGLATYLSYHNVHSVTVCGLALDYCVKATALDAVKHGFLTHVILNATAAVNLNEGDAKKAIDELEAAGVHTHGELN